MPPEQCWLMTMPLRLALFIDAQNAYRRARACFYPNPQSGRDGHFYPVGLGRVIEGRGGPGGAACTLTSVRVYCGRPDPIKAPRTYVAHRRQTGRWAADGATVITRALRYPRHWPQEAAQEKGIDVALAIDFVTLAVSGAYDVGVIMSTDSDLQPALEFVRDHDPGRLHVAVAAWGTQRQNQRLHLPSASLWCHWLSQQDYNAVADQTNY